MSIEEKRKVGRRGQVTIPKRIRDKEGIEGGDEVVVKDEGGLIIIEKRELTEELAEGYRKMAERDRKISEEMLTASEEALE
ncbi:AbrB family transcriptional regulator [candidate division MSBL1 archaeon SCGC-AAA259D14]|uniref:AbrB family transcriptional regulator n=1 Tax=candidate division MSBL1 archaeon SCGC-AAA259D14 TaxID=1698261 RepID=A0A133U2W3_9EURY|nr:AbrB family transcriptional regulator [candidate division MSBL1 archaeon SCGC-AAA259D14]